MAGLKNGRGSDIEPWSKRGKEWSADEFFRTLNARVRASWAWCGKVRKPRPVCARGLGLVSVYGGQQTRERLLFCRWRRLHTAQQVPGQRIARVGHLAQLGPHPGEPSRHPTFPSRLGSQLGISRISQCSPCGFEVLRGLPSSGFGFRAGREATMKTTAPIRQRLAAA